MLPTDLHLSATHVRDAVAEHRGSLRQRKRGLASEYDLPSGHEHNGRIRRIACLGHETRVEPPSEHQRAKCDAVLHQRKDRNLEIARAGSKHGEAAGVRRSIRIQSTRHLGKRAERSAAPEQRVASAGRGEDAPRDVRDHQQVDAGVLDEPLRLVVDLAHVQRIRRSPAVRLGLELFERILKRRRLRHERRSEEQLLGAAFLKLAKCVLIALELLREYRVRVFAGFDDQAPERCPHDRRCYRGAKRGELETERTPAYVREG